MEFSTISDWVPIVDFRGGGGGGGNSPIYLSETAEKRPHKPRGGRRNKDVSEGSRDWEVKFETSIDVRNVEILLKHQHQMRFGDIRGWFPMVDFRFWGCNNTPTYLTGMAINSPHASGFQKHCASVRSVLGEPAPVS